MMALLNWRVWAAVLVVVALAGTHWKTYVMGSNAVRAEWNEQILEQTRQTQAIQEETARKTAALQAKADQLRRTKNAEIDRLNTDLAAALDGLRNRPPRPGASDLPAAAGSGAIAGCTGAELYRPDAAFLTRLAGEADRLRIDLGQCQAAYDSARKALTK